ncbi:sugar transferase [Bombiscardovia coagulans]|uniref:Exopolysaccharide biosynthesis polyprenyl glycosylphosphotransferase n=1 Tax=Bombiscardovia coagulans TaxID=686666 RepID=A0A261EQR1_9BIFI|nr:sugar transferase [Bombiscardovia coagulans]OZG49200.1 exopolysaccharide biosynthesis polyprenyl glycosylphosphotransferase [Bombiscardovia coagulans]
MEVSPSHTGMEESAHTFNTVTAYTMDSPQTSRSSTPRFTNQLFDQADEFHPAIQQIKKTPLWSYMFVGSMVAVDVVAMLLALLVCVSVNPSALSSLALRMHPVVFTVIQCGIWVLCLLLCGTYHRHVMSEGYELYTKIINAALLTIAVTSCLAYILKLDLPRISVIIAPLLACIAELLARWQMRRGLHKWRSRGQCKYQAVIVGSPDGIDAMLAKLNRSKASGYLPIAVCPIAPDPNGTDGGVIPVPYHGRTQSTENTNAKDGNKSQPGNEAFNLPVITYNSHLPRAAESRGAQIIIIADVITRDSEIMHTLPLAVESLGIELAVSISVADIGAHRIDLDYSGDQPIMIATLPQYSTTTRFIKRLVDIIGSTIALIVSGPLVILPAAIAIKLEDHGPVFYKQKRIGRNEVPFDCYKLRSMSVNADKMDATVAETDGQQLGALFKVKDDPRVTKVGKFIRKYSIDEFPQFWNVLKGDMSLVGPRPQRQYEVDCYGPLYSTRLLVRPGITGPWQISGRSDLSQEEAEQLDVSYIQRWSITGDLAIIAKTFVAVLKHQGSY